MFVMKKKYNELLFKFDGLKDKCSEHEIEIKQLDSLVKFQSEELHELKKELVQKNEEIKRLNDLSTKSDENEVILRIGDDLVTIIPIIRWKDTTPEKLIEAGMISDGNHSKTTTQVALMAIAHEALEEIIENFTQPVTGGE